MVIVSQYNQINSSWLSIYTGFAARSILFFHQISKSKVSSYPIYSYKNCLMPDQMMYQQDDFVVLEPNQDEQFLTAAELLAKLKLVLSQNQQQLPQELHQFDSIDAQAKYLMDTSCELVLEPGQYLQWYAVRLEK